MSNSPDTPEQEAPATTGASLLHALIREQNRALYALVQNVHEDVPQDSMSKHLIMALQDAEELCQKPSKSVWEGDTSDPG